MPLDLFAIAEFLVFLCVLQCKYFGTCDTTLDLIFFAKQRINILLSFYVSRHAHAVKKWRILLEQSFTAHLPLLMATSAF